MQTNKVTQQLSLFDVINQLTLDEMREVICKLLFNPNNKPRPTYELPPNNDRLVHIEDSFVE
jgi:hypothetical protein